MTTLSENLDLSAAQQVGCPVCNGSGVMPSSNLLHGMAGHTYSVGLSYACNLCRGSGVANMLPNGALFPLEVVKP